MVGKSASFLSPATEAWKGPKKVDILHGDGGGARTQFCPRLRLKVEKLSRRFCVDMKKVV